MSVIDFICPNICQRCSFLFSSSFLTALFLFRVPCVRRTLSNGAWTDVVVLNKDKDPNFLDALAAWRADVENRYSQALNVSVNDLWSLEVNRLLFRSVNLFNTRRNSLIIFQISAC